MSLSLIIAAVLAVLVGIAHSILGERFILIRLFRRELPKLFGTDLWTKRILRFAWHVTTIAWFGFAAVLVVLASDTTASERSIGLVIAATCLMSALLIGIASRLRHPAWAVFVVIAALVWVGV